MRDNMSLKSCFSTDRLQCIQSYCLALAMFFPAIKVSMSLVFLLMIVLLELLKFNFKISYEKLSSHRLLRYALLLFLLFPVSMLWSDNISWSISMVKYYVILGLIPIFILGMKESDINLYLFSFVSGVIVISALSYFVHYGYFDGLYSGFVQYNATPFTNHMVFNVFVAFSVYILIDHVIAHKQNISINTKVLVWIVAAFLSVSVFFNYGRIGQIAFFILFFLAIYHYFLTLFRGFCCVGVVASLLGVSIFVLVFYENQVFHERLVLAIDQAVAFSTLTDISQFVKGYEQNGGNSIGGRLFLWIESFRIFLENPYLGTGIGDFPDVYNQLTGGTDSPLPMYPFSDHIHPHNQTLYFMAAMGVFGLFLFLLLLYKMLVIVIGVRDEYRWLRLGFFVLFVIIIQSDCYLFIAPFSLLFVFMIAVFFSGKKVHREKNIH